MLKIISPEIPCPWQYAVAAAGPHNAGNYKRQNSANILAPYCRVNSWLSGIYMRIERKKDLISFQKVLILVHSYFMIFLLLWGGCCEFRSSDTGFADCLCPGRFFIRLPEPGLSQPHQATKLDQDPCLQHTPRQRQLHCREMTLCSSQH